ncbi:hypothetical protein EQG79_00730 [Spirosoma sordidisoli]|uniref:Uncharacterized protein n=1 Tax=Spirosoma sordidisoli TaxID=2502893 RepID=A0A4Q2USL0_9BACT|nr:hypothetical protein EQG79_00730 [Spirosoma sordidisoli]
MQRDETERAGLIRLAVLTYGYLVPMGTTFTLDYLGELIRQFYDQSDERNRLLADLCTINADTYKPIRRTYDGGFNQI